MATTFAGPATSSGRLDLAVVDYSGVNFSDPGEVAQLYRRLEDASWEVCESSQVANQTFLESDDRACFRHVLAEAVKSIGKRELTALLSNDSAGRER